jgi:hypothetical protein
MRVVGNLPRGMADLAAPTATDERIGLRYPPDKAGCGRRLPAGKEVLHGDVE